MRMKTTSIGIAMLAAAGSLGGVPARADLFTPAIVSPFLPATTPVLGTDGKYHAVYELVVANTRPTPATLRSLAVIDAAAPDKPIANFDADALKSRLRTLNNKPSDPAIEFNGMRLFLIDLTFDTKVSIPATLLHRPDFLAVLKAGSTIPEPLIYTAAPVKLGSDVVTIGPPLRGRNWVAFNGCCAPGVSHRTTAVPVNGALHYAQRFAIDWIRMDDQGRMVRGDPGVVTDYTSYDDDIVAVADGTVIETLNDLQNQVPGQNPDPKTITIENVDGNHVVLDIGGGRYAFYAHMKPGSVTVKAGDKVVRGQLLGKLGNTGNTTAPHLHFHIMDGPSVLGSEGIPYVFDSFGFAGNLPESALAEDLSGSYAKYVATEPQPRREQFPLGMDIIDFP